ncbi:MAG: hypothetical protein K8R57_02670 [Verrucomicrobia bacterium]|nr:hypothetical protein [Verrucomicrobiota bacterium]
MMTPTTPPRRRMLSRRLTVLFLLFLGTACDLRAENVTTTDGQVYANTTLRKAGSNIMIQIVMPGGGSMEMGLPIARIAKVSFVEPPELAKASDAASSGNAPEVLVLTESYVAKQGDLKEVPGSWWPQMARLRLFALAASAKDADAAALAREIGVINNPASESLARGGALFGPLASGDTAAVVVGAKALPSIGGDAGSSLAQLALGRALLDKKDFAAAIRAFLTIKVFYPSPAMLQPAALLGAVKAYEGLKDAKRAARTLTEIVDNYPASPQASDAKKMIEALPKP